MASHWVLLVLCIASIQLAATKLCPDIVTSCTDQNTCCPMKDNLHYGCCPQPDAVCCSDHVHCCPAGMTCDIERTRCSIADGARGNLLFMLAMLGRMETPLVPLQLAGKTTDPTQLEHGNGLFDEPPYKVSLQAALINGTHRATVPCPDGTVCPGDYTCCSFTSGNYGCCPYSQGVCCPDHLSCCPHGTTCSNDGSCRNN